jgi:hypothetical protein
METTIAWGRYGELFDYDADGGELVLDPDARVSAGRAA